MIKWDEDIKKFRQMKDGWFDGYCEAPSKKSIDNADFYMNIISDFGLNTPLLFPYTEGGIIGEWADRGYDIIFHNDGRIELTDYDESFEISIKKVGRDDS